MNFILTTFITLISIIGALLSISIVIIVHELGHFYAAKLCGLQAKNVVIGFGQLLYQYTDKQLTSWEIRLIPLGGYVNLTGQDTEKIAQYIKLSYLQKTFILFAGIITNLLVACLLLNLTNLYGFERKMTIIGKVYTNSPASKMQLKSNDLITKINHVPVNNLEDTILELVHAHQTQETFTVDVIRDDKKITLQSNTKWKLLSDDKSVLRNFGIRDKKEYSSTTIHHLIDFSDAEKSGLRQYDRILYINDVAVLDAHDIYDQLQDNKNAPVNITFLRHNNEQTITLNTTNDDIIRGIRFKEQKKDPSLYFYYQKNIYASFTSSLKLIYNYLFMQSIILYHIIIGELSILQFSGPIKIITLSYQISSAMLITLWLRWIAAINIALAFINALPIPLLDGGQWCMLTLGYIIGERLTNVLHEALAYLSIFFIGFFVSYITYYEILEIILSIN